jgi:site-specific DNA recombinase
MADHIIGITLERDGRMVPLHPGVERVMQKEIRQDRAHNPTLWRSSLPRDEAPILHLYGCLQPTFNVQKHPWAIRVFADRAHQQLGIDLIEEALDVEIQNPRVTPASLPRHPDRIERRFAGSISIGVLVEAGLH